MAVMAKEKGLVPGTPAFCDRASTWAVEVNSTLLWPAARLLGRPGCPLRELELGNTTKPSCSAPALPRLDGLDVRADRPQTQLGWT